MSAFGLSKALNISRPLAADYIDSYFHKYPGVKLYMERTKELAKEKGYVETFFGRRLYLPESTADAVAWLQSEQQSMRPCKELLLTS